MVRIFSHTGKKSSETLRDKCVALKLQECLVSPWCIMIVCNVYGIVHNWGIVTVIQWYASIFLSTDLFLLICINLLT